eukprot:3786924-Lingulodinium_polyedra.AAC.1
MCAAKNAEWPLCYRNSGPVAGAYWELKQHLDAMVFHEPAPADLAHYTIRLCSVKDVPTIAGPPHYFYIMADGGN